MKTTIYLIRHGESVGNQQRRFLGHTDLALTELGHRQAENTARFFDGIHLDKIFSSDLLRAYQTAEHTAERKGLLIERDRELREIFAGKWEGRLFADLKVDFPDDYGVWLRDIGKAGCTGGESVADLSRRILAEVERLARENEGKTVAIFTHATPIRIVKNAWDGNDVSALVQTPWASNASVTHAEYENGVFRVLAYGMDDFQKDSKTVLPKNC